MILSVVAPQAVNGRRNGMHTRLCLAGAAELERGLYRAAFETAAISDRGRVLLSGPTLCCKPYLCHIKPTEHEADNECSFVCGSDRNAQPSDRSAALGCC